MHSLSLTILAAWTMAVDALPSALTKRQDAYACPDLQTFPEPNSPNLVQECYQETSATNIVGDPQTVSGTISCDTDSCSDAVSNTYTVEQSFSFDISLDTGDIFKSSASVGASWEWSSSQADSITQTFNLVTGDVGYIIFWPYLHQSCGAMTIVPEECGSDGCESDDPSVNDPNACGTTPLLINTDGDITAANGAVQFCYTAGDKSGQGCDNPPAPPQ